MTEEQKLMLKALQDNRIITAEIDVKTAVCIVMSLQLAWRHPAISEWLKAEIQSFSSAFEMGIDIFVPGMFDLLEKGWDTAYDVTEETDDND